MRLDRQSDPIANGAEARYGAGMTPATAPVERPLLVPIAPAADGALARVGPDPAVLDAFGDVSVPLVAWQRPVDARASAALAAVARALPPVDETVPRLEAGAALLPAALRGLPGWDWLAADIDALVARFADATAATRLRFAFGAVLDDKCKRFHVDFVRARMVVTYTGPGTQWLDGPDAARFGPRGTQAGSCGHGVPPAAIRSATAGDVVWMRGVHGGGAAAVHRSPPLGESGVPRVVFTLSTAD